jgi:hypothetical protein
VKNEFTADNAESAAKKKEELKPEDISFPLLSLWFSLRSLR